MDAIDRRRRDEARRRSMAPAPSGPSPPRPLARSPTRALPPASPAEERSWLDDPFADDADARVVSPAPSRASQIDLLSALDEAEVAADRRG